MTNRTIAIYDGLTDTFVEREATNEEQAEIDAQIAALEKIGWPGSIARAAIRPV